MIDETTEKIVIDYTNLTGRDEAHRAEFRKKTREHIAELLEGIAKECEESTLTLSRIHEVSKKRSDVHFNIGGNAGMRLAAALIRKHLL